LFFLVTDEYFANIVPYSIIQIVYRLNSIVSVHSIMRESTYNMALTGYSNHKAGIFLKKTELCFEAIPENFNLNA